MSKQLSVPVEAELVPFDQIQRVTAVPVRLDPDQFLLKQLIERRAKARSQDPMSTLQPLRYATGGGLLGRPDYTCLGCGKPTDHHNWYNGISCRDCKQIIERGLMTANGVAVIDDNLPVPLIRGYEDETQYWSFKYPHAVVLDNWKSVAQLPWGCTILCVQGWENVEDPQERASLHLEVIHRPGNNWKSLDFAPREEMRKLLQKGKK